MVSDSKRSDVLVMEWVEGWPGSSVLMTPLWVLKAAGASTAAPAYPRGMAVRVGWGGLRLWGRLVFGCLLSTSASMVVLSVG